VKTFIAFPATLLILSLAAPALANDIVPLPHLRPASASGGAAGASAAATAIARPNVNVPFNPSLPFSAAQQQALANIDAYMNSFSLMEGKFIQVAPNGNQSDGVFFISRPGKIRFHFNPPSQVDIIASNGKVAVEDKRVGTQDEYPLSKTPLRYLLADRINLLQPGLVSDVQIGNGLIQVTIVETSNLVSGKITMTFDVKTYALQRWVVTDAQGGQTSFGIYDTVLGKPQNPELFWIVD
jgi:outer membrane lipoprotein-sorting protein